MYWYGLVIFAVVLSEACDDVDGEPLNSKATVERSPCSILLERYLLQASQIVCEQATCEIESELRRMIFSGVGL